MNARAIQEQQQQEARAQQQTDIQQMQQQLAVVQAQQAQAAVAPAPQAGPAAGADTIAQLTQLADLKTAGLLTDAEFEAAKARVLGG